MNADKPAPDPARVRAPEIISASDRRGRRVAAFHPAYRAQILALTSTSSQLEDLADSFPALLFALISGYADVRRRELTCRLVCQGAPLRRAADTLGLAWWLRKLPAAALCAPLPCFPADPEFGLRVLNLLPREPQCVANWLRRVAQGMNTAGRDYALWIARQPDLLGPSEDFFALLAAWAWYSGQTGLLGYRLLRKPFATDMSLRRAREELMLWRQRLRLIECLGPGIETPWLADGHAGGFSFVALRTVDDFISESEILENCLDQYADQLRKGLSAVFSIRRGLRHVACVEIGIHDEEVTMPRVVQLRALRNRRAPPEIWQATFAWLGGQRLAPLTPERQLPNAAKRLAARRQLWQPYLNHLRGSGEERTLRQAIAHNARLHKAQGTATRQRRPRPGQPPAALRRREPAPMGEEAGGGTG